MCTENLAQHSSTRGNGAGTIHRHTTCTVLTMKMLLRPHRTNNTENSRQQTSEAATENI